MSKKKSKKKSTSKENGIPQKEQDALQDLEKLVGKPLVEIEKVTHFDKNKQGLRYIKHNLGYVLKNGRITELGLCVEYPTDKMNGTDINFDRELTKLPASIGNFENLVNLDLLGNLIRELPEKFGNLKKLKTLNLNGNRMHSIPASFINLESLEKIDLSQNNLTRIPESYEFLAKAPKLKQLNLSNNDIKFIEKYFIDFPSLEVLNLSENELADLSDYICSISSLKNLNLSNNKITNISKSINKLKSLQTLNLRGNQIKILPKSFSDLKSLKILNLAANRIKSLPNEIGDLINIEQLFLEKNQIIELPDSIGNLSSIKKLVLARNNIKDFPNSFSELKSIENLDVSTNKINHIPLFFANFDELKQISLKGNPLKGIDREYIGRDAKTLVDWCKKRATINIFISHSVSDFEKYRIKEIADFLESKDEIYKVIYCEQDLVGDIDSFMDKNVPECHLLLFIATKQSISHSKDCEYELKLADSIGIPIITIKAPDLKWKSLSKVSLHKINLSRNLGLEFNEKKDFTSFLNKLYDYIKQYKRRTNLSDRSKIKIVELQREIKSHVDQIIESKEFEKFLVKNSDSLSKSLNDITKELSSAIIEMKEWSEFLADMFKKFNSKIKIYKLDSII